MNIEEILKSRENENLEFKKCINGVGDEFWETYSSFANTAGGTIILGVEDKNSKVSNIIGIQNPYKLKNDILNNANNKDIVNINILSESDIKIHIVDNKSIISIEIKEVQSPQKPVYTKDKIDNTFIRKGEADQKADKETIKYLMLSSSYSIDSELLDNFDLSDLNKNTILKYAKYLKEKIGVEYILNNDNDFKIFLKEIGIYRRDRTSKENVYKIPLGGLIFFGKYNSIKDKLPHFHLDYFYHENSDERWTDRVSTGDMSFPDLNLFDFYQIVLEKLNIITQDKFSLDEENSQRLPFRKDLQEATREALVNTIMHAYYLSENPIKIIVRKDFYEFYNPGSMKITVEEFLAGGQSKTINEVISTLLRKIGISERAGSGGKKISEFAKKYKLRKPDINITINSTTVRIWKEDLLSTLNLVGNDYRLMEFMIKNTIATKKDICSNLKLSDYYSRIAINNLLKKKLIIQQGNGKSTKFVINTN